MLAWVKANTDLLNLLLNAGMLLVWIAYLQVFLLGYLRQRQPSVLVTRGAGVGLDARCIVGNMSADPVYVMSIIARLSAPSGITAGSVTDLQGSDKDDGAPLSEVTKQGPLLPGHYMQVDTYRHIIARLAGGGSNEGQEGHEIEITVIAAHGSDDLLIGARRAFRVERRDGQLVLVSLQYATEQIRSRAARRRLQREWRSYLEV